MRTHRRARTRARTRPRGNQRRVDTTAHLAHHVLDALHIGARKLIALLAEEIQLERGHAPDAPCVFEGERESERVCSHLQLVLGTSRTGKKHGGAQLRRQPRARTPVCALLGGGQAATPPACSKSSTARAAEGWRRVGCGPTGEACVRRAVCERMEATCLICCEDAVW